MRREAAQGQSSEPWQGGGWRRFDVPALDESSPAATGQNRAIGDMAAKKSRSLAVGGFCQGSRHAASGMSSRAAGTGLSPRVTSPERSRSYRPTTCKGEDSAVLSETMRPRRKGPPRLANATDFSPRGTTAAGKVGHQRCGTRCSRNAVLTGAFRCTRSDTGRASVTSSCAPSPSWTTTRSFTAWLKLWSDAE